MCTTSNQGFWKNITNYINLSLAISSEDFIEPEEERSFVSSEQEEGFIEVRISITDDLRLEPNETFTVMISSTERDSSIVTFIESQYLSEVIINDNDRANVSFTELEYTTNESAGIFGVPVVMTLQDGAILERNITVSIRFNATIMGETNTLLLANSDPDTGDYQSLFGEIGQLTFSSGSESGETRLANISIRADGLIEADEKFGLYLETDIFLTDVVTPSSTIVTIQSFDEVVFGFDSRSYISYEHEAGIRVCVVLENITSPSLDNISAIRQDIELRLDTTEVTANSPQDFNAITDRVLSFENGTPIGGQICEVISIVNDSIEEPNDEVFSIDISNPVFLLQDITLQFPNVFVTISDCKNLVV